MFIPSFPSISCHHFSLIPIFSHFHSFPHRFVAFHFISPYFVDFISLRFNSIQFLTFLSFHSLYPVHFSSVHFRTSVAIFCKFLPFLFISFHFQPFSSLPSFPSISIHFLFISFHSFLASFPLICFIFFHVLSFPFIRISFMSFLFISSH